MSSTTFTRGIDCRIEVYVKDYFVKKSPFSLIFLQLLITLRTFWSDNAQMNIAVFASGRGSNFEAILHAIDNSTLPARVVLLLTNNSNAGVRIIAQEHRIPSIHLSQKKFASEEEFAQSMLNALTEHRVELIALAGYMKYVPKQVIEKYRYKILNIHPALLPAFGGAGMFGHHVHEAVLASGVKYSGATVHFVDEEYDHGPILLQKVVEVFPHDTVETLAARVLKVEHEIYPLALTAIVEGRVKIEGRKAWIIPAPNNF